MFCIPTIGPDCWRALLADPVKHWATGYSARTLAYCWQTARGLPPEITTVLGADAELLLGIPEHKTRLPGGNRASQSDLFALLRLGERTCAATIEGKVNEPFGPTVGEWLKDASAGKKLRLDYICRLLGLDEVPATIRYQLLHRTAAAVIESERFKTDEAAMLVHSFSPDKAWFADFAAFAAMFNLAAQPETLMSLHLPSGKKLYLAWVTGAPEFLTS